MCSILEMKTGWVLTYIAYEKASLNVELMTVLVLELWASCRAVMLPVVRISFGSSRQLCS